MSLLFVAPRGRGSRVAVSVGLWIASSVMGIAEEASHDATKVSNDAGPPSKCKWCQNDAANLRALGAVSHGPMQVGNWAQDQFQEELIESDWIFLETPHFRFASSLGDQSLSNSEKQALQPLWDRLRAGMPKLPKKPRKLDPWLRLHLAAMRLEDFYARFQSLLQVVDSDFPEERGPGPFMGMGRYLGEKEKFEIVLHERVETHQRFTEHHMGVRVTDSVRWHSPEHHKMIASIPAVDSDLRQDRWLYPHVVHNLSHMLLAAYKHFSFDPPIWLDAGLSHMMEKEIEPDSFTREGEEGTFKERSRSSDWAATVRKLVQKNKTTGISELMRRNTLGELSLEEHITVWSMVRFLADRHPEALARFVGDISGQLDERGYPSGKDLPGLQRKLMRELWDWSPQDFDAAWKAWVLDESS